MFLGPLAAWAPVFFNHVKAVKPLVEQAGALRRAEDIHIGGWQFNQLPSLNYYAQREITHHQNEAEALAFLRYPVRVFLFLPAQNWIGLAQQAPPQCRLIARHWDIQRRRELVVVTNQPE